MSLQALFLLCLQRFKCKSTRESYKFLNSAKYIDAILDLLERLSAALLTSQITCNVNYVLENFKVLSFRLKVSTETGVADVIWYGVP